MRSVNLLGKKTQKHLQVLKWHYFNFRPNDRPIQQVEPCLEGRLRLWENRSTTFRVFLEPISIQLRAFLERISMSLRAETTSTRVDRLHSEEGRRFRSGVAAKTN
jgi:hypothetical protein